MNKYLFAIVILLAPLLDGCTIASMYRPIILRGSWLLYDIEFVSAENRLSNDFWTPSKPSRAVSEGMMLHLFNDSTYSILKGEGDVRVGKWDFDPSKKILVFTDSGDAKLIMHADAKTLSSKKQMLELFNNKTGIVLRFLKQAAPLSVDQNDPFHPDNINWRFKPNQPEDSIQLAKKITGYIRHLELLLKSSNERNDQSVSFAYSHGPVKIYNGGIGIYPFDKIEDSWKNTFYSEGDARKAYELYENCLEHTKYKGASAGNWVDDDAKILQLIEINLKKLQ